MGVEAARSQLRRFGVAVLSLAAAFGGGAHSAVAGTGPRTLDPGFGGRLHGDVAFDLGAGRHVDRDGLAVQPDGGMLVVGTATGGATSGSDAVAYRHRAG
jgi:hypothetical protein